MNTKLEAIRAHEAIWRTLHAPVVEVLREFCEQGMLKERDYFVVEDDLGWDIVETELVFSPLWPRIARSFQLLLADFSHWRITMQVMRKYTDKQPGMGVIVSVSGIKDELRREFLPAELRDMTF